ncbi:MAG: OmpA family protein [Elusimicrobia bacterium]|nr:OmpA family protein [Elusimicrobiota bacterium]
MKRGEYTKALDYLADVWIEGDAEEKRLANHYLHLMLEKNPQKKEQVADEKTSDSPLASEEEIASIVRPSAVISKSPVAPKARSGMDQKDKEILAYKKEITNLRAQVDALRKQQRALASRRKERVPFQEEVEISSFQVAALALDVREQASGQSAAFGPAGSSSEVSASDILVQEIPASASGGAGGINSSRKQVSHAQAPVLVNPMGETSIGEAAVAGRLSKAPISIEDPTSEEGKKFGTEQGQTKELPFKANGTELEPAGERAVEETVRLLSAPSSKVIVRGFASPMESNSEDLAKVRAKLVERLLKKKYDVPSKKIVVEWGVGVNQEDQRVLLSIHQ